MPPQESLAQNVSSFRSFRRTHRHASRHEPVLGTTLEIQAVATTERDANMVDGAVVAEFDRLEQIFSVFRPDSEFRRWAEADGDTNVGPELRLLLMRLEYWREFSDGICNPMTGELSRRWSDAECSGVVPSPQELAEFTRRIHDPRYVVTNGEVNKTGDCRGLNGNAIAKGLIIDMVARHTWEQLSLRRLVINVGGDLVHLGENSLRVNIEDPQRAYDNEPPVASIEITRKAVATSGRSRRGFDVGGTWFSHIIDPRTGLPVNEVVSATVIAPTAESADGFATIASVLGREASNQLPGDVCYRISLADGSVLLGNGWDQLVRAT
jgi:FAD:protein FMN transferase